MAFRDRLRKAQRVASGGFHTLRCGGCGESFKALSDTWLDLVSALWKEGTAGDEVPRDGYVLELEGHLDHHGGGDEIHDLPEGRRVFPPPGAVA